MKSFYEPNVKLGVGIITTSFKKEKTLAFYHYFFTICTDWIFIKVKFKSELMNKTI